MHARTTEREKERERVVAAKMLINIKSIEDKNKEVIAETPIKGDMDVNSQKDQKLQSAMWRNE